MKLVVSALLVSFMAVFAQASDEVIFTDLDDIVAETVYFLPMAERTIASEDDEFKPQVDEFNVEFQEPLQILDQIPEGQVLVSRNWVESVVEKELERKSN